MDDYIKREDAIEALGEEPYVWSDTDVEIAEHAQWVSDIKAIEAVSSADVRPVMRGYWKSVPHKRARVCSRCEADEPYKFADVDANVYDYCPHCGAKMEES